MAKKPTTSARKEPKQERSQGLVDVILTATARVLQTAGFDKSTTSRIAEIAGVSIGSLYQYFPNKESLIAALIERQVEKHTREIEAELERLGDQPLEKIIEVVVAKVFAIFVANRNLVKAVQEHAPSMGKIENILIARRRVGTMLKKIFEDHRGEIRVENIDQAVFTVVNAVMGIVDIAVLDFPAATFTEAELEREVIGLVKRYLK